MSGKPVPQNAVVLSEQKADALWDGLYALRCAAEDVATAAKEGADADELQELCDELVAMARELEHIR